jgi:hypothetical protein
VDGEAALSPACRQVGFYLARDASRGRSNGSWIFYLRKGMGRGRSEVSSSHVGMATGTSFLVLWTAGKRCPYRVSVARHAPVCRLVFAVSKSWC